MQFFLKFSVVVLFSFSSQRCLAQPESTMLIGTYTQTGSHGIYVARFNTQTGLLRIVDSAALENPSYLCISPNGKQVYAVTETSSQQGGAVAAFHFDKAAARLTFINKEASGGDHPCYVSMDGAGKMVAVANYTGGTVAMLPVAEGGGILPATQVVQHTGSGPNKNRQEKPHVHTAVFTPKGDFVAVADLGTDEVIAYPYRSKKALPLHTKKAVKTKVPAGAGPRHLAFHTALPVMYIMEELSGNVSVYQFTKRKTRLLQSIKSDTISAKPGSADIHLSPDGKYLYASNRIDANNLSIYAVNPVDGTLSIVGYQPVMGRTPRNFVVHPSGKWLLVANQQSNNIVVFERDTLTGLLKQVGNSLSLPAPVCLVFAD